MRLDHANKRKAPHNKSHADDSSQPVLYYAALERVYVSYTMTKFTRYVYQHDTLISNYRYHSKVTKRNVTNSWTPTNQSHQRRKHRNLRRITPKKNIDAAKNTKKKKESPSISTYTYKYLKPEPRRVPDSSF